MPVLLLVAFGGSVLIHAAALFGTDFELFGEAPEPIVLQAELQVPPPPTPPAAAAKPQAKPPARAKPLAPPHQPTPAPAGIAEPAAAPPVPDEASVEAPEEAPELLPEAAGPAPEPPPPPAPPVPALPANGSIRFAIVKESLGLQVGRAEHRWEFAADGSYRLTATSETSGLAGLLRPVQLVQESSGHLVAGGLRPDSFRSQRVGKEMEGADFDWSAGVLRLLRDGSVLPLPPGAQDLLSLNYQLAYLGGLADGVTLAVATARKFERHALDSLGEEEIETPAGRFRTLHLRALSETVTEIWIALDLGLLPVKIRFTDKKGESFEQVATDLGN